MKLSKNDVNSTDDSIKLHKEASSSKPDQKNQVPHEFYHKVRELIYLFRPVIYLLALKAMGNSSKLPLIVCFILEYLSIDSNLHGRGNFSKQKVYYAEYLYRQRRFWLYLLREPIVTSITIPFIKRILTFLRLPTGLVNWVETIIKYFTKYYYIL